jgi:hypothetical protein
MCGAEQAGALPHAEAVRRRPAFPHEGQASSGTRPGSGRAEYPARILLGGVVRRASHVTLQKGCQRRGVQFWRDLSKQYEDGRPRT